jgi:hypothetical protein
MITSEESIFYQVTILQFIVMFITMAVHGFENKQKWKKVWKTSPLLAILPEGPQKKIL